MERNYSLVVKNCIISDIYKSTRLHLKENLACRPTMDDLDLSSMIRVQRCHTMVHHAELHEFVFVGGFGVILFWVLI